MFVFRNSIGFGQHHRLMIELDNIDFGSGGGNGTGTNANNNQGNGGGTDNNNGGNGSGDNKDGDGKEIEKQNRHERSMYVSLAKDTTYYMYMKVPSSLKTKMALLSNIIMYLMIPHH